MKDKTKNRSPVRAPRRLFIRRGVLILLVLLLACQVPGSTDVLAQSASKMSDWLAGSPDPSARGAGAGSESEPGYPSEEMTGLVQLYDNVTIDLPEGFSAWRPYHDSWYILIQDDAIAKSKPVLTQAFSDPDAPKGVIAASFDLWDVHSGDAFLYEHMQYTTAVNAKDTYEEPKNLKYPGSDDPPVPPVELKVVDGLDFYYSPPNRFGEVRGALCCNCRFQGAPAVLLPRCCG